MSEEPMEIPGPDGVYGPAKPDWSKKKTSGIGPGLIVATVFCLLCANAGFFVGRAFGPQPSFQEYAENLARTKHCVPVLDWGVSETEGQVLAANGPAMIQLREQGMQNIKAGVVPITIGEKTYFVGILTWENCADS